MKIPNNTTKNIKQKNVLLLKNNAMSESNLSYLLVCTQEITPRYTSFITGTDTEQTKDHSLSTPHSHAHMYVYEYLFWLMHPTTQQFGALSKRDTLFSFDIYLYKSSFTLVKKAWWIQAASGRILSITAVRVVTLRVHKITFIIVGNKCFPKIDISSQNTNFVFFFF